MSCRFELSNTEPRSLLIEVKAGLSVLPLAKEQNLKTIISALSSEFSYIRKLTLAGSGLIQFDYDEYVSILRALPKGLGNLNISANYLDRFSPEQLLFLGYVLPTQLRCIKAEGNNLSAQALISFLNGLAINLPSLEQLNIRNNPVIVCDKFMLISIWQAFPKSLRHLLIDGIDLSHYTPQQIIELIPHYPRAFQSLHLDFGGWRAEWVFSLFRQLPGHLRKLVAAIPFPHSISRNMLDAWKTLPRHINEIEILDTSFQKEWIYSLSVFIGNLHVEKLRLAYNNLGLLEPHDAVLLTRSVSSFTKQLDLSYNQLPEGSIPFFFAGVSKNLKVLILHGNGFEYLPREKLISYFKFLPPNDIRLHFGRMKMTREEFETLRYNQPSFITAKLAPPDSPIIGDPVHLNESIVSLRRNSHYRFFTTTPNIERPPEEDALAVTKYSSQSTLLMPSPQYPQSISWLQGR
ncbi:hypothetical protein [Legionella sp. 16cNR16C]|uniref:hypothetical protein n=1 Tax=Legionella sp. 16cNR16C TaxID=2905656 RepID=UPI001E3B791B|nr:hypothetical protein [Legionella sp. 16cNR16C]MCE3045699.1 hypothetical protein [Legionella sp. 16cNR16C]